MKDDEHEDREAILARRRRWIALAIAGAAAATSACAEPCLAPTDSGLLGPDAGRVDASPQPCLTPVDASVPIVDAGADDAPDGE